MENMLRAVVILVVSTILVLFTLADAGITDRDVTLDDVIEQTRTGIDVINHGLKCYHGFIGYQSNHTRKAFCYTSCRYHKYREGVRYSCASKYHKDGCNGTTCYCNQPLCNKPTNDGFLNSKIQDTVSDHLSTLAMTAYNDKSGLTDASFVDVQENFPLDVNYPSSGSDDVIYHYSTNGDVTKDRTLKCYSGYVGQGMKVSSLRKKDCHGSCATKPFGKGVIFDCAVAFVSNGCWPVQGSPTCFCNKPLCNDGTLPTLF